MQVLITSSLNHSLLLHLKTLTGKLPEEVTKVPEFLSKK